MSFSLPVVFLAFVALAIAQYNPYSPHPPANARDPSLPPRPSSTYNRAQDFRAAGKNPGYRSSFTLPLRQGPYDQQRGKLNEGSAYNGGSQIAPTYNEGANAQHANSYGNGMSYGDQQDGGYGDLAQPSPDDPDGDSIVGVAGSDYPTYSEVPMTSFQCSQQQFPGLYADTEAQCQVFHICQDGGRYDSFLCPNGSIFNQQYFVCDWWYNVECQSAPSFYGLNADLYKDVNRYSAAASYGSNLAPGSFPHTNGQGPSAAYGSNGQAQSSASGNGREHHGAPSAFGNGSDQPRTSSANGNGREHHGGNGRGHSGASSAYGNGNGREGFRSSAAAYSSGNGRVPSRTSSSAYGNGNANGHFGATPAYGNGRGRSGAPSSAHGNGNGMRHFGKSPVYDNGNGRGKAKMSSAYGSASLASGSRKQSQNVNKQLQNDDYSIVDMPPLGY